MHTTHGHELRGLYHGANLVTPIRTSRMRIERHDLTTLNCMGARWRETRPAKRNLPRSSREENFEKGNENVYDSSRIRSRLRLGPHRLGSCRLGDPAIPWPATTWPDVPWPEATSSPSSELAPCQKTGGSARGPNKYAKHTLRKHVKLNVILVAPIH